MPKIRMPAIRPSLIILAGGLLAACADQSSLAPEPQAAMAARPDRRPTGDTLRAITTLRRVTERYHDLEAALGDGFVLLHPCEDRPGEGPVGTVYYHPSRLMDGVIDTNLPDALIYQPGSERSELVAVEFAVPYALWTRPDAPRFLGASFQREDEFGVFALHAWVWRENPEGLFAETNPTVSCGAE